MRVSKRGNVVGMRESKRKTYKFGECELDYSFMDNGELIVGVEGEPEMTINFIPWIYAPGTTTVGGNWYNVVITEEDKVEILKGVEENKCENESFIWEQESNSKKVMGKLVEYFLDREGCDEWEWLRDSTGLTDEQIGEVMRSWRY